MDYTVHEILQARTLAWVNVPFSRESSQPRDRTQVPHIAGGFFTSWATREAQEYWSEQPIPLQGIFPTQELNRGLLHCRRILYQLSYQGSPNKCTYPKIIHNTVRTVLILEHFSLVLRRKRNPGLTSSHSLSLPPALENPSSTFYLYGFASSGHFTWIELFSMWLFCLDFFHLACFQDLSML